jgi:thiamine biosynthesis lipoprotein
MRPLANTKIVRAIRTGSWRRRPTRGRRHTFHYEHVLGTSLELQVVAELDGAAHRAEAQALAELDRLEPILSGWSRTSELARWMATHDVPVAGSPELAEVLEASDAWRERTQGAFDPAAQAIVELLRDGPEEGAGSAARATLLDELRNPRWVVDRSDRTARRLTRLAISLDAIAKGYIVTRAAARARNADGVTDVLLNVGGDLPHFGTHPVAVGVADPSAPAENAPPIAMVRIQCAALATSGGYRRGFVANGRRVSHIVDPRTGRPAERIASASVFAPDCATADALSTAFSVMDPRESVALADSLHGVGCLLIEADGTVTANAAWNARAISPRDEITHSR